MSQSTRSLVVRYGLVPPVVVAAVVGTLLLERTLGPEAPFLVLLPTTILIAWYGGFGPGLLATIASALAAIYFLLPPRFSWLVQSPAERAEAVVFVVVGVGVSLLSEILRRAKERLRASAHDVAQQREQLRTTLASIADAVIATDVAGRIVFLNIEAQRLTGWPESEAANRPFQEVFHAVEETSLRPIANPIHRVLQSNGPVSLDNHTLLVARDGSRIPIDDSAAPIRNGTDAPAGVVLVFRDTTERRRLEEEIHERMCDLATEDRRKNEFLTMLAHELRSPLGAIQNAAAALHGDSAGRPALARSRDIIERQAAQMSRLVDDLLDVTRIGQGKLKLLKEPVDLHTVVASAVETVRPTIDARQQSLAVSLPPVPLQLEADLARLTQVLVNLLANAAKYTDEQGHIWLSGERAGAELVLRVRDDGIGIAPTMLPYLFDLYAQSERALYRSQGGLGIGLTLARRLVEMHDGSIQASSAGPGKGSEFVVRLPALPATQDSAHLVGCGSVASAGQLGSC
jgi:two-component system CheB/CheR fusion protein